MQSPAGKYWGEFVESYRVGGEMTRIIRVIKDTTRTQPTESTDWVSCRLTEIREPTGV